MTVARIHNIVRLVLTCEKCMSSFILKARCRTATQRFCSKTCAILVRRRLWRQAHPRQAKRPYFGTPEERFWRHVEKRGPDECWPWLGASGPYGHGMFYEKSGHNAVLAHRFSFRLHGGHIPPGLFVIHSCNNGNCVNHSHLRTGTQYDNMQDMKAAGGYRNRRRKGSGLFC